MEKSRRQFLTVTSAGLIGAAAAHSNYAQAPEPQQQPTPGAPPALREDARHFLGDLAAEAIRLHEIDG